MWKLTSAAAERFPDSHSDLTVEIISAVRAAFGEAGMDKLLRDRTRRQLEEYRARAPFDLVLCHDVLQYLPGAAAQRALSNFGRLCRGMLYFSALTRYDYEQNCDQARTDAHVHLRSAHWYRTRLRRQFREAGLGFWVRRGAPLTLWELDSI